MEWISFSLGEFGIDRFIAGDTRMGILKSIVNICCGASLKSVFNICAIKEYHKFSKNLDQAILCGKESELIDEIYNNTLSESDRANFKKYNWICNRNGLSESDKSMLKKSDLMDKAGNLLISSLSKFDLVKIGSLVITGCIGCAMILYDIFTACGRAKQANYNYLLNMIGKK